MSQTTVSLTPSQVAFGADFEKDPFVQSRAGGEGLQSLLTVAFDGFHATSNNPFLWVMMQTLFQSPKYDCSFSLGSLYHSLVGSMLVLLSRSEKSVGTALIRG